MTVEVAAWIQAIAAVVQGLAAVAVGFLTWRLIEATNKYVEISNKQVALANASLDETRRAREAGFQPLIHGLQVNVAGMYPWELSLIVRNIGNGPAIDLSLNDNNTFVRAQPPRLTIAAGDQESVLLVAPEPGPRYMVPLAYGDIAGTHWLTKVGIDLAKNAGPASQVVSNETERVGG